MIPINPEEAIVVLVEDQPHNAYIVQLDVEDCGVEAFHAVESGVELFQLCAAKPDLRPHLILLDIQLPGENGYEILAGIRQHPQLAGALVVATTANVMPDDLARAEDAGFDGFIGKPFSALGDKLAAIFRGERVWAPR